MVEQRNPIEQLRVTARWAANLLFALSVLVFALLANGFIDVATSGKTGMRLVVSCVAQGLFALIVPGMLVTIAWTLMRAATKVTSS